MNTIRKRFEPYRPFASFSHSVYLTRRTRHGASFVTGVLSFGLRGIYADKQSSDGGFNYDESSMFSQESEDSWR
jgi:hypothetical protein